MSNDIYVTRGDIYLHHHHRNNKVGGSLTPTNNTIRRIASQVNNASTCIAGLGTQSSVLSRSAFKPLGTSVIFGGSMSSHLGKLNFNTDKKERNIRLRL